MACIYKVLILVCHLGGSTVPQEQLRPKESVGATLDDVDSLQIIALVDPL